MPQAGAIAAAASVMAGPGGWTRATDRSRRDLCPLSLLSTAALRLVRLGFHETFVTWTRRSTGNGRKFRTRPAPCDPLTRVAGKGGAADEAAARRMLWACPLADAKAAGFEKRPAGFDRDLRIALELEGKDQAFGPGHCRREGSAQGLGPTQPFRNRTGPQARSLRNRQSRDLGPGKPSERKALCLPDGRFIRWPPVFGSASGEPPGLRP